MITHAGNGVRRAFFGISFLICAWIGGIDIQAATNGVSPANDQIQALIQQKRTLLAQERALETNGATAQAIQAWQQQNAAQLQSLNQQIQALVGNRPHHSLTQMTKMPVPANASPELKQFLQNRQTLANSLAQLENQTLNATPAAREAAHQQWAAQNAALLQQQAALSKTIAAQKAQQPIAVPGPTVIPPNASPQLQAYLTDRDQLMRDEIAVENQYRTADPQVRQAALAQWREQNATRIAQLRQLAQNLSNKTSG